MRNCIGGHLIYNSLKGFYINPDFDDDFTKLGLDSVNSVLNFTDGQNLQKANLSAFRGRFKIHLPICRENIFLKTYNKTPILKQIKNWICHRSIAATGEYDFAVCDELNKSGINTAKTLAFGYRWGLLFEKCSFVAILEINDAVSLEKQLPKYACFADKRTFIDSVAYFASKFHKTGFRHRDFYLCHLFYGIDKTITLIDLQRVFKPILFSQRYLIKDLSQLYYSSPAKHFTKTDRLRFYKRYKSLNKITIIDKAVITKINRKAAKMAAHDKRHNRPIGYYI